MSLGDVLRLISTHKDYGGFLKEEDFAEDLLSELKKCGGLYEAMGLLNEALAHVTQKPWDDPSGLHARITRFLGK